LPRSRCTARGDGADATGLSVGGAVPSAGGLYEWVSCAPQPRAVATGTAGASAGDRDQRRPPAHAADLRPGAVAAGVGRSRSVHRGAPDQTPAPQAWALLQAASPIQGDYRFPSWPAGGGESAGAAFRCPISVADLAQRHNLYPYRGGLALLGRAQGPVYAQDRRLRDGRAHDAQSGHRVAAASR